MRRLAGLYGDDPKSVIATDFVRQRPGAMIGTGGYRPHVKRSAAGHPVLPHLGFEPGAAVARRAVVVVVDKHAEAIPLLDFAQATFEKRLGPDAVELGDIHVAHAWINFRKGNLAESGKAWKRALRIREITPGARKIELQKVLVGTALVQVLQRDFAGGQRSLDRAQAILVENNDTVSEAAAAIQNAYTHLWLRQEDFAAARRHAETQIAIEEQLSGGAPQRVPAYVLLGQILERLDEYEAAEQSLRQAIYWAGFVVSGSRP